MEIFDFLLDFSFVPRLKTSVDDRSIQLRLVTSVALIVVATRRFEVSFSDDCFIVVVVLGVSSRNSADTRHPLSLESDSN